MTKHEQNQGAVRRVIDELHTQTPTLVVKESREGRSTFIVAENANGRAVRLKVKTSSKGQFVTKFFQQFPLSTTPYPQFWLMYFVHPDGRAKGERFFVVPHTELAPIQAVRNSMPRDAPWEEVATKSRNGVDAVFIEDVERFESAWNLIPDFLGRTA